MKWRPGEEFSDEDEARRGEDRGESIGEVAHTTHTTHTTHTKNNFSRNQEPKNKFRTNDDTHQ